jgi:hypothetical protein
LSADDGITAAIQKAAGAATPWPNAITRLEFESCAVADGSADREMTRNSGRNVQTNAAQKNSAYGDV